MVTGRKQLQSQVPINSDIAIEDTANYDHGGTATGNPTCRQSQIIEGSNSNEKTTHFNDNVEINVLESPKSVI